MSLYYLVKQSVYQSVHNHSNASIKRHDKLTVTDKRSTAILKMFAFGVDTRTETISALINCLISDTVLDSRPCWDRFFRHFRWVSLYMMRLTYLCKIEVSLAIWRRVLCVPGAPSWLNTKLLTSSMFSAVRDVRGVPLIGCQSVVPVSRSF